MLFLKGWYLHIVLVAQKLTEIICAAFSLEGLKTPFLPLEHLVPSIKGQEMKVI